MVNFGVKEVSLMLLPCSAVPVVVFLGLLVAVVVRCSCLDVGFRHINM